MWNVYLSKMKVHHEMRQHTQRVPHIIMCTQKKNMFEFLKYNNICSLTAILIESNDASDYQDHDLANLKG